MKKNELKALKDYGFLRRLYLYDYNNPDERITQAWADEFGIDSVPDENYSDEFIDICIAVMESVKEV